MKVLPLSIAVAAALGVSVALPQPGSMSEQRSTYIVRFEESSLASFDGRLNGVNQPKLLATSPAITGEQRLNVRSEASVAYLDFLRQKRESRLQQAASRIGRSITPSHVYDVVLNGVAVELSAAEAQQLLGVPGIKAVEPERVEYLHTASSVNVIKAPDVWSGASGAAPSRGEGMIVGVIDTGINASHPSFAASDPVDAYAHSNPLGSFRGTCVSVPSRCTNKLIGVYDMTTGTGDAEANDGLDLDGHGSHTASTAAGNQVNQSLGAINFQIKGVAPRANIISYKACEEVAACRGSWTTAAIQQAVTDGVDVINYSIGGGPSDPWSSATAMRDARNAGVVIAVSAGNGGPDPGTTGSPANAPWVMSVANTTHDRKIQARLVDLTGGASAPPNGGILIGESATLGYGPAALARDPIHPKCSTGSDLDFPPTGVSNPWSPGRWSGQIVVCDRGTQARVAKSNNVRLAGGGGMVLVNTAAEGASTNADEHSIPSTHLSYADGQLLLNWMATGTGHSGRIEAAAFVPAASQADALNVSSARGPVIPNGTLKPEIAAPGTNIFAAAHDSNSYAILTGTSMAAPHVAGAAALVKGSNPSWNSSRIISALLTTTDKVVKIEDNATPANPFEGGSGRLNVARAARAALFLNIDATGFANGQFNPRGMNLPALIHEACAPTCSTLTRSFTDMAGGGNYTVDFALPAGVSGVATVPSFAIGNGATQSIGFNFSVTDPALYGQWVYGDVTLRRTTGDGRPDTRLPVALYVNPGVFQSAVSYVDLDRDYRDLTQSGLLAMPNARFAATEFVAPTTNVFASVPQDSDGDVWDNTSSEVVVQTITVPQPVSGLPTKSRIEVSFSGSGSMTMYFGSRSPGSRNEICSTGNGGTCTFETLHPGSGGARSYWAMIRNTGLATSATVTHSVVEMTPASSGRYTATGPGMTTNGVSIPVRFAWNDPTFVFGQERRGAVMFYAAPGSSQPMGYIPVRLTRASGFARRALHNATSHTVTLAAAERHDGLFFDVPAYATSVTFTTSSSINANLFVEPVAFSDAALVGAAPVSSGMAERRAVTASGNETISLSGAQLSAGRWYVAPVNADASQGDVTVTATINSVSAAPLQASGHFYNPTRSGHGIFYDRVGGQRVLIWYAYLQDGTPTWYYAQAADPSPDRGSWSSPIARAAWNGSSNVLTIIGSINVTEVDADNLVFTYNIDGETGSETMQRLNVGFGCPSGYATNGHWYSPSLSGYGFSAQLYPGSEFYAAYAYDGQGRPRWITAQPSPFNSGTTHPAYQLTGFGPLGTWVDPITNSPQNVGTLTRTFNGSNQFDTMGVNVTWTNGVPGSFVQNRAVTNLTSLQACP